MANDSKRDPLLDDFEAFLGPDLEDRPYRLGESPNSHSRWQETLILRSLAEARGFKGGRLDEVGVVIKVAGDRLELLAHGVGPRLPGPLSFEGLPGLGEARETFEETRVYQLADDTDQPPFRLELRTVSQTFPLTRAAAPEETARLAAAVTEAWYRGKAAAGARGEALRNQYLAERRAEVMGLPRPKDASPVLLPRVKIEAMGQGEVNKLLKAKPPREKA